MGTSLLRLLEQADIVCPAGRVLGEATVACGVEGSLIDGQVDTASVAGYCCGDYKECPSWRKEKEAIWRGEQLLVEKPKAHVQAARRAAEAVRTQPAINEDVLDRVRRREALEQAAAARRGP